MPEALSEWKVADGVVRIILFRVSPGHEFDVGKDIESRCDQAGISRKSYRIFRLFGNYDLVYIEDGARLNTTDFVKLGSIPHIIGVNEYVCYKWSHLGSNSKSFDLNKLSNPLLALCFLKINPAITQAQGITSEIEFAEFIRSNIDYNEVQIVGTLGWFEVVMLVSHKSLSSILDLIGNRIPHLIYNYQTPEPKGARKYFAEKTLSLLGHNLDVSDQKLEPQVSLRADNLEKDDLIVHFSISCHPRAMAVLEENAKNHFVKNEDMEELEVSFRFGANDLDFRVPLTDIDTLSDLLHSLDNFRKENQKHLIKTFTDIQYQKHAPWGPKKGAEADLKRFVLLNISPEDATKLAENVTDGSSVLATIYQYNNMVENSIITDAFTDLLRYAAITRNKAFEQLDHPAALSSTREFLVSRLSSLKEAIAQRARGTYSSSDQAPLSIGGSGVGIVRANKALEAYIHKLVNRFGRKWNGFVNFSMSSRFEHKYEVIVVPNDSCFVAQCHWAISHETMHVLQSKESSQFSNRSLLVASNPALDVYKDPRRSTYLWNQLHEIIADILGYAVTCPLKVNEYIEVIWDHLGERIFKQHHEDQRRAYFFRSMAVLCYEMFINQDDSSTDWLSPKKLIGVCRRKKRLFQKIPALKDIFVPNAADEIQFDIWIFAFVADVGPALPYILPEIQRRLRKVKPIKTDRRKLANSIKRLKNGVLLSPTELQNPEALSWLLGYSGLSSPLPDNANLAWMLSLWHCYHTESLGINIYEKQG